MTLEASFWEHLEHFQKALRRSLFVILAAFLISLFFYEQLFSLFTPPLMRAQTKTGLEQTSLEILVIRNTGQADVEYNLGDSEVVRRDQSVQDISSKAVLIPPGAAIELRRAKDVQLLVLGPVQGIGTVLKACFWVALVGSSPIWTYILCRFIIPGLHHHEVRALLPFISLSLLLMMAGFGFAYYITLPVATSILYNFNDLIGSNAWTVTHYLDFSLVLLLASALSFESAIVLFGLVHFGVVSSRGLREKRALFVVVSLIGCAILTPPDVFTQVMMALPLVVFYEGSILYARYVEKRTNRRRMHEVPL